MVGLWRRKPAERQEEILDLSPMPSIFERPARPPLPLFTLGELIPPVWRVLDAAGAPVGQAIRFLPDGRVLGLPDGRSGRWEQTGGKLIVSNDDGTLWSFDRRETRARRDTVAGQSAGSGEEVAMRRDTDDLHTACSLHAPSRPLLVVFNSHASPFDERVVSWDFAECIGRDGTDSALFSERAGVSFWYLNKTGRVLDRLRPLPAAGYRELVMIGQGSGGFAAMLFAELLSYEYHDCRIRSVTINAQTAHGAEHEAALRERAEPGMLPPFVDADALSQLDCPVPGIRELVRMSKRRRQGHVEHAVLHDDGNPAQAYYAHTLSDLDGFALRGVTLGLSHEEGQGTIRRSAAFHDALAWGLEQEPDAGAGR